MPNTKFPFPISQRFCMVTYFLIELKSAIRREYVFCTTTWNKLYVFEACLPVTLTSAKMGRGGIVGKKEVGSLEGKKEKWH